MANTIVLENIAKSSKTILAYLAFATLILAYMVAGETEQQLDCSTIMNAANDTAAL